MSERSSETGPGQAGPPIGAAAIRDLARDLREASDSAILRVTGVIDQLPERGDTDRLLEGLRPRLGHLRPKRALNLSRALFLPMDPIIVPAAGWRGRDGTIPRTLIAPVCSWVQQRLPDARGVQDRLAAGHAPEPKLWQDAARILADDAPPDAWSLPEFQSRTGIRPKALPGLLAAIRLVFAHADLFEPTSRSQLADPAQVRTLLLDAARSGPTGWSVALALLFEQSTAPAGLIETVLAVAAGMPIASQLGESLHHVVAATVDKLDRAAPSTALSDAALDAQALRVARLAGFSALQGNLVGLSRSLARRRQEAAEECSAQLAAGLEDAAAAASPVDPATPEAQQDAAERLESRLQALRRLELAARPLGDAPKREALLARTAAAYGGKDAPAWLTPADRMRCCEILVGAEAALRLAGES